MSATDTRETHDAAAPGETLADLLMRIRRATELGLRVAAPARVSAYNPATQRAELVLEQLPVLSTDAGSVPQPPIPLPAVPVAWPRTAAGYLTLPLVAGDTGLVVFADRGLSEWLRLGIPGDPITRRTHDLADGVFFPGLHPDTSPIAPPTSALAAVLEGPLVWLGAVATQPAVLGTLLRTALDTYATAITSANSALNAAAQVYFAIPVPTPPQQVTFQTAWAAWNTATGAAQAALATALVASLSTKVLVQ